MIGYHYTSKRNWLKIQKEGLVPYPIKKIIDPFINRDINSDLKEIDTYGIWVWTKPFSGIPHVGSIIYQMGMKGEFEVVLLRVSFSKRNIFKAYTKNNEKLDIHLYHSGHIENLYYHNGSEEAVLVTKKIPIAKIKLIGEYSFENAWKDNKDKTIT